MTTTAPTAPQARTTPLNSRSRVLTASLVGTTIEFYDFYVYATAASLVFPALFFPEGDDQAALLASFGVFGAAMVARPIGGVVFGHFGDRIGRKATLVASLLTMGIATFLIGVLPVYGSVGLLAPLLLLILRLAQGFALGGEWSGAALVATENAPSGKRALWGTFPQLGAPIGFILANTLFLVLNLGLSPEQFSAWGWRVPFLFSAVMVAVGLWVRLRLVESDTFQKAEKKGSISKVPLGKVFAKHPKQLVFGTFFMLATYVLFYLLTSFITSFATTATDATPGGLGFDKTTFVLMEIIGVVFFGVFTLVSGPLADAVGRRKMLIWVTLGIIASGLTYSLFLTPGDDPLATGALAQAFLVIGFTLMGLTFGPMGALLPELFPTSVRYTGSAISYNVSSILGAAVAPFIAVWLWGLGGGSVWLVGLYLAGAGVLTLIALIFSSETKDVDIDAA